MNRIKKWALGILAVVLLAVGMTVAIQSNSGAQINPGDLFGSSATAMPTTCALDNVGWIVCPILRSAAKAGDYAFTFISHNFLGIEVSLFKPNSGTAQAWSSMRNIANVLFVVAFLVVIYSLITGKGVGNYNIKRMLPRFIIGAIMVNISYYICQVLIDISNVAGSSINSLFAGVTRSIGPSGMPLARDIGSYNATVLIDITASVLGKVGVAWVLFAPLAAIVLAIAIVCSIIIVVLLIRKTLVVALVLLSPIAFVAYLLPNTEHYFSKWLRVFLQTLLLFPIVAVLLGTGQVVSATIIKAGADGGYKVRDDEYTPRGELRRTSATLRLVAAGAAVLPLAGTWYVFKLALAGVDAASLRIRQGARRSGHHKEESAKRREQAAMDLNKKSMMLKGINRLQQISAVQDGDAGATLMGRLGGSHRGRKKQKSAEQAQFDEQVQNRLSELRSRGAGGLTPQQVYSQALQRYQDAQSGDSQFSINSYEGIDLKASEAYLLESISQGSGGIATTIVSEAGQAESQSSEGKSGQGSGGAKAEEDKGATSHYDKPSQSSGGSPADHQRDASRALKEATTGGGAVQTGQVIVVQQPASGESGQSPMAGRGIQGVSGRPDPLTENEMRAKARAAKYLQQSQDIQELSDADPLLGGAADNTVSSTQPQNADNSQDPSDLRVPRGS